MLRLFAHGPREQKASPPDTGAYNGLVATGPVLARWLGVSGKTVYELAKAGILVRISLLEESVRRYCDHIRRSASQSEGTSAANRQALPEQAVSSAQLEVGPGEVQI